MKRQPTKTGPYGLGSMIHVVHMTDDVPALNKFYDEVFSGLMFLGVDEPNFLPNEDRWAGLMVISDLCIETMAPADQSRLDKPVAKFYSKFGQHLHSVGYAVDDLVGLGAFLGEKGLYIGKPGGGQMTAEDKDLQYFYPSPRDTYGLMVELCSFDMPHDPRLLDNWSSQVKFWEKSHPLGIKRLAYVTLGVKNLDEAVARYVELFEVEIVHSGVDESDGSRFSIVHLGDCLLRLAEPTDPASDLGLHVSKFGNMIYSLTFQVGDLDAVEQWLTSKGVRSTRATVQLLNANPADTFGAPYSFTTVATPGDPFA